MKVTLRKDLISGVFFLLLAVVVWWIIPLQIKVTGKSIVNSQTFPKIIAIVIFGVSLVLIVSDILKMLKNDNSTRLELLLTDELKSFAVCLMLVGYAVLMEFVGFLAGSLIFSTAMLLFPRCRKWKYYLIIYLLCIAVSYLFKNLLLVQLP